MVRKNYGINSYTNHGKQIEQPGYYEMQHRKDCGKEIMQLLREIHQIPYFNLDTSFHYVYNPNRAMPGNLPIGITNESAINGRYTTMGFLNTKKSLFLGGTNIAQLTVERGLDFRTGTLNVSVQLDAHDRLKEKLLGTLQPEFTQGTVRRTPHGTTAYTLFITEATTEKVQEAYEGEITFLARKLKEVDRKRGEALQNADEAILATLIH